MNKFSFNIFEKDNRPFFDNNKFTYTGYAIFMIFCFLAAYLFQEEKWLILAFFFLASGIRILGSTIGLFNILNHQPLKGIINGKIKFEDYSITLEKFPEDIIHLTEKINYLKFHIEDYKGEFDSRKSKYNLNPSLKNGVNNSVKIQTKDFEIHEYFFQQEYKDEYLKMKDLLIHYCINHIINFDHLIELLKIKDIEKIENLKEKIKNVRIKNLNNRVKSNH